MFLSLADPARRLGLGKSTLKRAFDELATKGFIGKISAGDWYGRKAATWRVTTEAWQGAIYLRMNGGAGSRTHGPKI